jgi:hypothetical protein
MALSLSSGGECVRFMPALHRTATVDIPTSICFTGRSHSAPQQATSSPSSLWPLRIQPACLGLQLIGKPATHPILHTCHPLFLSPRLSRSRSRTADLNLTTSARPPKGSNQFIAASSGALHERALWRARGGQARGKCQETSGQLTVHSSSFGLLRCLRFRRRAHPVLAYIHHPSTPRAAGPRDFSPYANSMASENRPRASCAPLRRREEAVQGVIAVPCPAARSVAADHPS